MVAMSGHRKFGFEIIQRSNTEFSFGELKPHRVCRIKSKIFEGYKYKQSAICKYLLTGTVRTGNAKSTKCDTIPYKIFVVK
jgi:hypothetical protein